MGRTDQSREKKMSAAVITQDPRIGELEAEIANFRSMMDYVNHIPDDVSLRNFAAFGESYPLNGVLGGDHIIFVDFKVRYNLDRRIACALDSGRPEVAKQLEMCRNRVGILLADSAGHDTTDALLTAMLHQAFLTGVLYELETQGQVTAKLFEVLNTRFAKSSSVSKFLTIVYCEINDDGAFRFVSAGHPKPLIFSAEYDCLVDIDPQRMQNVLPIGISPSEGDIDEPATQEKTPRKKPFSVNEVNLMGKGDILLLQTDGLYEHADGDRPYTLQNLEAAIRSVKELPPKDIVAAIRKDMVRFAPPKDDTSVVVIKKTN
jgi:serine phosphatase RsbU (regulator of sigma subunit)